MRLGAGQRRGEGGRGGGREAREREEGERQVRKEGGRGGEREAGEERGREGRGEGGR